MIFQCIYIRQVPWQVLKTAAFGLGFQHIPRDLAIVNAWKPMFYPYIKRYDFIASCVYRDMIVHVRPGVVVLAGTPYLTSSWWRITTPVTLLADFIRSETHAFGYTDVSIFACVSRNDVEL